MKKKFKLYKNVGGSGGATYRVSLPIQLLRDLDMENDEAVNIEKVDGGIMITKVEETKNRFDIDTEYEIDKKKKAYIKLIVNLRGKYDTVNKVDELNKFYRYIIAQDEDLNRYIVECSDSSEYNIAKENLDYFSNLGIVSQGSGLASIGENSRRINKNTFGELFIKDYMSHKFKELDK